MGSLLKTESALKNMVKILPARKCCDLAAISMQCAINMIENTIRNKKELDAEFLSRELVMNIILLLSSENHYDCLPRDFDFHYPPRFEGGAVYNSKFKDIPRNTRKKFDLIHCCIGIKLKNYSCHIVRPVMINVTKTMEKNYNFMVLVWKEVMMNLRAGIELYKVYEAAQSLAEKTDLNLAKHLKKEFGVALGPNLENELVTINSKSKMIAQENMTFMIAINLLGLKQGGKEYSLRHSDTVAVRKDKPAEVLTHIE